MDSKKPMTKGEIVDHLATKLGVSKKLAGEFLTELVDLVYQEAGNEITLPGLGKFTTVERGERTGRNPKTGESMVIPAKKLVKFKVSKTLQDTVVS